MKFVWMLFLLKLVHSLRIPPTLSWQYVSRKRRANFSRNKVVNVTSQSKSTLFNDQSGSTWSVKGLTQSDLLYKDECILVDQSDNIVGHDSKFNCHRFTASNPTGKLHRAFSVFIFNDEGKILLHERASSKITFPSVWTNACCSHPLFGQTPNEVDNEESIRSGNMPGIRAAVLRKLEHELGIDVSMIDPQRDLKFLTRVIYHAPDSSQQQLLTQPQDNEFKSWGENEIDYIFFLKGEFQLEPNPDEIASVVYKDRKEFFELLRNQQIKWSPWFRLIAEKFLNVWWDDLNITMNTDTFVDMNTIHKL